MITIHQFKTIVLSFPETEEHPHFENLAYKVKKKIFVTLNEKAIRACVKLSEIDQSTFSSFDKNIIYPVPNKWGKHGWTNINLQLIEEEMLMDALTTAYCEVAPKTLSKKFTDL